MLFKVLLKLLNRKLNYQNLLIRLLFLILIIWTCVADNQKTIWKGSSHVESNQSEGKFINDLLLNTSVRKLVKFSSNQSIDEIVIENQLRNDEWLQSTSIFDDILNSIENLNDDYVRHRRSIVSRSLKDDESTNSENSVIFFWGKWSKWSKCSRSCGGGVQSRVRNCLSSNSTIILKNTKYCVGLYKRYRLCNDKECEPNSKGLVESFRNKQCRSYDNVLFAGQYYEWEEYLSIENECELNCIKKGTNVYAKLNDSVIDGTPCKKPSVYFTHHYRGRAVCVEGICKAVHATGAIRGVTTEDSPYRCGSVLCRPITGSYTKPNLPRGYFFIATIPLGAWNISISQPSTSKNRLVLRTPNNRFIIDGEQEVAPNTTYLFTYQNNFFEYRRDNEFLETITTRGYLSRAVDLMILVKDVNPGVTYSYFIPISTSGIQDEDDETDNGHQDYLDDNKSDGSDETNNNRTNDKRRSKFTWKLIGFGPCSKSCGGGYQPPIFRCVRDSATRFYTPRRCMHLEKPVFHELVYRCNTKSCPAYWHVEDWGDCFCHNGKGSRERQIKCVQEQSSGVILQVDDNICTDEKPESKESCGCPKPHRKKVHSQRSERSRIQSHLRGTQSVISTNETIKSDNINLDEGGSRAIRQNSPYTPEKNEKEGSWLMSEWSNHCSTDCGIGVEHRSIFCDRSAPNTEPCDLRTTPDTTRFCESERNCDTGSWFTGRWSECSGDCFNLTKKRDVFCVRDIVIVDDVECAKFKKPDTLTNCSLEEVHYCKPKWYYSDWTPCSRSCGGGTKRRIARCLEPDIRESILRESKECRYSERHSIFSTCNNEKCPDNLSNQRIEVVQNHNEIDREPCVDMFSNCHLIDKGRVCKLNYYTRNCCATCSKR